MVGKKLFPLGQPYYPQSIAGVHSTEYLNATHNHYYVLLLYYIFSIDLHIDSFPTANYLTDLRRDRKSLTINRVPTDPTISTNDRFVTFLNTEWKSRKIFMILANLSGISCPCKIPHPENVAGMPTPDSLSEMAAMGQDVKGTCTRAPSPH